MKYNIYDEMLDEFKGHKFESEFMQPLNEE